MTSAINNYRLKTPQLYQTKAKLYQSGAIKLESAKIFLNYSSLNSASSKRHDTYSRSEIK